MIPELGQLALVLALLVATVQGVVPLVGAARRDATLMAFARPAAITQFALVALAFGCLAASFLLSDFSVANVAQDSFSAPPASTLATKVPPSSSTSKAKASAASTSATIRR